MSTAPPISPNPDPFARFRRDHAGVRERLDLLDARLAADEDAPAPELGELVAHLERQFATHMAAEESILFPAVAETFPAARATLAMLALDHAELRSMLAAIAALAIAPGADAAESLRVELRDFVDLLRLHVHREEIAVFDVAMRALSGGELAALAQRLHAFLDQSRSPSLTEPNERNLP
jgi:hemerythrin-like domain-containing protein